MAEAKAHSRLTPRYHLSLEQMATTTSLYTSLTLNSFGAVHALARTLTSEAGRTSLAPRVRRITLRLPEVPGRRYLAQSERQLEAIFKATVSHVSDLDFYDLLGTLTSIPAPPSRVVSPTSNISAPRPTLLRPSG